MVSADDPNRHQSFSIDVLIRDELPITGSYCSFYDARGEILRSDWIDKIWLKINGKIYELRGTSFGKLMVPDKQWKQTFQLGNLSVLINLRTTKVGGDSAAMDGEVVVNKDNISNKIIVHGGCGA